MHSLVKRIFNRETQRPSAAKLWQMPQESVFPMPVPSPPRSTPLEVQATSYLAAADRMVSLSSVVGVRWVAGAVRVWVVMGGFGRGGFAGGMFEGGELWKDGFIVCSFANQTSVLFVL